MNFKNINKILIVILTIFLYSCSTFVKKSEVIVNILEGKKSIVDKSNIIEVENGKSLSGHIDHFNLLQISKWDGEKEFIKLKVLKTIDASNDLNPISLIFENKLYLINKDFNINVYSLENFNLLETIYLDSQIQNNNYTPLSLVYENKNLYISYSNGDVNKFDINGKLIWHNHFDDIIKTPIKFFNNSIIILLTDKIISLNSSNGLTVWEFQFESDNHVNSLGGDIVNLNHLILYILPNNKFGIIDTLFGEKVDFPFMKPSQTNETKSFNSKLHVYENLISYFKKNKYLYTYDFGNSNILLDEYRIDNINSYKFYNNSLITLNSDGFLEAHNIVNNNIFWKSDINKLISKNDIIINLTSYNDDLIIFFKSGLILEVNYYKGTINNYKQLKTKNVKRITFVDNYLLIDSDKDKLTIFKQ